MQTIFLTIIHWFQSMPAVSTLLMLQGLDICSGICVAVAGSNLCSAISWRGMAKKGQMLIMVIVGLVAEPMITKVYPLPLASIIAIFFIITEVISIIENASLMGLPVPKGLVDKLVKMSQDAGVATPLPAPTAEVKVTVSAPAEAHLQTNTEALDKKTATQKITVPLAMTIGAGIVLLFLSGCQTPTLRVPLGKWVTIAGYGVFWVEAGSDAPAETPRWKLAPAAGRNGGFKEVSQ